MLNPPPQVPYQEINKLITFLTPIAKPMTISARKRLVWQNKKNSRTVSFPERRDIYTTII